MAVLRPVTTRVPRTTASAKHIVLMLGALPITASPLGRLASTDFEQHSKNPAAPDQIADQPAACAGIAFAALGEPLFPSTDGAVQPVEAALARRQLRLRCQRLRANAAPIQRRAAPF
jgi:hypothetical protein